MSFPNAIVVVEDFLFSLSPKQRKNRQPVSCQASKPDKAASRPAERRSKQASRNLQGSEWKRNPFPRRAAAKQISDARGCCRRPPLHGHREAATSLDPGPTPSPSPLLGALPDSISQFKRSWGEGEVRLAWQAEHVCEASPICHVLPGLFCREGGRRKECEWAKLQATMQVT